MTPTPCHYPTPQVTSEPQPPCRHSWTRPSKPSGNQPPSVTRDSVHYHDPTPLGTPGPTLGSGTPRLRRSSGLTRRPSRPPFCHGPRPDTHRNQGKSGTPFRHNPTTPVDGTTPPPPVGGTTPPPPVDRCGHVPKRTSLRTTHYPTRLRGTRYRWSRVPWVWTERQDCHCHSLSPFRWTPPEVQETGTRPHLTLPQPPCHSGPGRVESGPDRRRRRRDLGWGRRGCRRRHVPHRPLDPYPSPPVPTTSVHHPRERRQGRTCVRPLNLTLGSW